MRLVGLEFRPGLWPSLATLVLVPALAGLGLWQLERAGWKQGLIDAHEESLRLGPVDLDWLLEKQEPAAYRPVGARGRYDLEHQLLLDNRIYRGHAGYHVLTPLRLAGRETTVLVNRGWVPVGADRSVLPELPGPAGEVVLEAVTDLPPAQTFRLGEAEERHAGWPKVVQELDFGQLERLLDTRLAPVVLLLDAEDEHGFMRDWRPVYTVMPDKHRAYAMQWFTLAAVLLLIYLGVNTRRISGNAKRKHDADE